MRTMVISLLLIVAIIAIYNHSIGGVNGMQSKLLKSGEHMSRTIERINLYGEQ